MNEQRRQQRLKLMKKAARYKVKRLEAALGGSFNEHMKDHPRHSKPPPKHPSNSH